MVPITEVMALGTTRLRLRLFSWVSEVSGDMKLSAGRRGIRRTIRFGTNKISAKEARI